MAIFITCQHVSKPSCCFSPPSSRVPRFHQGGNLAHFLGKHAQVLGPGGAWLETGVTELRSFEGVYSCEMGNCKMSEGILVRTPMIVFVVR